MLSEEYLLYKAMRIFFFFKERKGKGKKTTYFPKVIEAVLLKVTQTLLSKTTWFSRKTSSLKVQFKN